jgi:hypothetical protein
MMMFVTLLAATDMGPLSRMLSNDMYSSTGEARPLELFPNPSFHLDVFFATVGAGGAMTTGDEGTVMGKGGTGTGSSGTA